MLEDTNSLEGLKKVNEKHQQKWRTDHLTENKRNDNPALKQFKHNAHINVFPQNGGWEGGVGGGFGYPGV